MAEKSKEEPRVSSADGDRSGRTQGAPGAGEGPERKVAADKVRSGPTSALIADPGLNRAAKALAVAHGKIEAKFGGQTPAAEAAKTVARERIARAVEEGREFSVPKMKTKESDREQEQRSEADRSR